MNLLNVLFEPYWGDIGNYYPTCIVWKVVFRNWDAVVIFPSFVLFYNRHISLKLAYIEEKVMICECDGYRWMGPSLSSVALTTSTVEDRFSFTGNKDIREHFVFRLRTQPWIGLSCICGRHSSASFLSFVDWRLKHCTANNKRGCFAPSSNVVCFNDPVCVCFDTWFQPRDPFGSLNCIMVFL